MDRRRGVLIGRLRTADMKNIVIGGARIETFLVSSFPLGFANGV